MESRKLTLVAISVAILALSSSAQKTSPPPSLTPTPAPAPAQDFVNLTELLSVAGPFKTFLSHLISTKVIETLQNQANDTEEGVTIFVPKDSAFSSQNNPSLKNLTSDQLKQLLLFHALPHFYTFSDFGNLSESSPVNTMAGGGLFSLNFSDSSGTIRVDSGWTRTKISSSVHSSDPCAVYQIDKVLIPEAIFGTDLPPMPAPAPAPEADATGSPAADSPAADSADSPAKSSPGKSGSPVSFAGLSNLIVSVAAAMAVLAVVL